MDNLNEDVSMNDMMEQIEKSMKKIREGQIIKGKVISVSKDEVLVNIAYMADGIIKKEDFGNIDTELKDIVKPEDDIYVYVVKLNDGEGNVLLSKKMADEIMKWKQLEQNFKKGKVFEVTVDSIVKGGAISYVDGIRVFIPASHISYNYVKDLNKFLNKSLKVKIIEFDRKKKNIVVSAKEVEKHELEMKIEELWKSLKKGEKRKGKVTKFMKFGAFVDLGGKEGLIHLNDLSWKRINHPSEVLNIGDEVSVFVQDFDKDKGRISLALKDIESDPWNNVEKKYKVGDVLEGTVVNLLDFGAFIQFSDGIEGLLHKSEISDEKVLNPSEVFKNGDKVKVKILEIDKDNRKMSLSLKAADDTLQKNLEKYNDKDEGVTLGELFKDKLKDLKLEK